MTPFFNDDFRLLMRGMLPAIIAVFIGLLLYGIFSKVNQTDNYTTFDVSAILKFERLSKTAFFDYNKSSLVIYFNPDCEHCQYEARAIRDSLHRFAQTNIILISDEPAARLESFGEKYDLLNRPNVHILYDANGDFKQLFGTNSVPSIFIYNQERELVKHFKGETKIEAILKYMDNKN